MFIFYIYITVWILHSALNYPFVVLFIYIFFAVTFTNEPTTLNVSFLAMLTESIQRLLRITAAHHRAIKNAACCLSASRAAACLCIIVITVNSFPETSRSVAHERDYVRFV